MADVTGIHKQLDDVEEVRTRLRGCGKLIVAPIDIDENDADDSDVDKDTEGVKPSVGSLAYNAKQMEPWALRWGQDLEAGPPKVASIFNELLQLYEPYAECKQGAEELCVEMWEVRKHLVKLKGLAMKLKTRRVTAMFLLGEAAGLLLAICYF